MKPQIWSDLANELGVPWRSAEAMHWMLGADEMARRANAVPFTLGPSGYANQAISSASSTPFWDSGFGASVSSEAHGFAAVNENRRSFDRGYEAIAASVNEDYEGGDGRGRRRRVSATYPTQGHRLAPVAQRMQTGSAVVLPSLAEVETGVVAYAGFAADQHRFHEDHPGPREDTQPVSVHQGSIHTEAATSPGALVTREEQAMPVQRESRDSEENEH